jgi:hypothetical protein
LKSPPATRPTSKLANAFGRELVWHKTSFFGREHVLGSGPDTFARFQWHGFRSARVSTADRIYHFKRTSLLRIGADMFEVPRDRPQRQVLTVTSRFRAGSFVLPDGAEIVWKQTSFFKSEVEVRDGDRTILRCRAGVGFLRTAGSLVIEPAGAAHPMLEPLALAAWYVAVRIRQRRRGSGSGS